MKPSFLKSLCVVMLIGHPALAWAVEESYTLDPAHTFPTFEVNHLGFSTQRGRFDHTRGKVVMDQQNQRGSVDIEMDAASVDTGVKALDDVLRGAGFLNVAQYPFITFHSSDLKFDGDKLVAVDGVLTMLGFSQPVTLKVTHFKCGFDIASFKYVCGVDAETTIKRSDFGITKFLPFVGDDVTLKIQAEGNRDQNSPAEAPSPRNPLSNP
jgi:polyisoprenoid-binding protein YceI